MRTALITGASGGIGLELARVFAADGWNLVLVARSADKLRAQARTLAQAHGISAEVRVQDLSRPEGAEEIFRATEATSLRIDALVNNAGIGTFGLFSEIDLSSEVRLLELNVVSLTKLTKLYLPSMQSRGHGFILNVASTAAFQPGPLMAVYYASKAYVLSFSEALSNELEGTGVSVTALCPGATRTGFQESARMTRSRLFKRVSLTAERVAHEGYRGMLKKKRVVIPGLRHRAMARAVRFFPRGLVMRAVRKFQESTRTAAAVFLACVLASAASGAPAEDAKTYTHPYFLYSIDHPASWKVKELSKVTTFLSPRESAQDKFAENVHVVVEDLSAQGQEVPLVDYYRQSAGNGPRLLAGFKLLEEARSEWLGRETIISLYTASDKGVLFKCKTYTFLSGKSAYVLTYTAEAVEFEKFLPAAERLMRTIRVSP